MPLRLPAIIPILLLLMPPAIAQVHRSGIVKTIPVTSDTIVLDSLSLVPGTVSFDLFPADSTRRPAIDYRQHALVFTGGRPDSIRVVYRRFPHNFEKLFFHKDQNDLYRDISRNNPFTIRYDASRKGDLFTGDGLNKNGNISRGITFGNNQDVTVNSNLNLQVSGKLTPDIDLLMAATDNNIPFQADGTTAQLQEFDKVFIQLNDHSSRLIVGDYQLARPQNSYFMNFYKRAQGFSADNVYGDSIGKKPATFRTSMAGAVSKGKFSRQVFFGTENNQGPYRLKGAENELFIVVLSGTERIYIDGKLLQRGQENDYIIDYNTAELTFTARQLITKDKRIVAEFQYAERNYARSLFYFGEEVESGRTKVFLNFFSEQDNKNRPLMQALDQDQKDILIAAGDSLSQAYYTGVEEAAFNATDVFYMRKDTTVNGIEYLNVYQYSIDSSVAKYRLRFSSVGAGRGNYSQVSSGANGRVFLWIAPVNGQPQGSYEPIIPLVTPRQHQMLTAGFSHSLSARHSISAEGVYTRNDINRFSDLHKKDDEGSGVKIVSRNELPLGSGDREGARAILNVQHEFLQQRFTQVERFRSIEFERDWNRPLTGRLLNDQHLASVEAGIFASRTTGITYNAGALNEGDHYAGLRHGISAMHNVRGLTVGYNGSLLTTRDAAHGQNTRFYRHKGVVSQKIEKIRVGYSDEYEQNMFFKAENGSLLPRA